MSGQIEYELEGDDSDFFRRFELMAVIVNVSSGANTNIPTPRNQSHAIPAGHNVSIVSVVDDLTTTQSRPSVNRSRAHSLMHSPNLLSVGVHVPAHESAIPPIDVAGPEKEINQEWILFNDFVVTRSSQEDATDFSQYSWRKPVVAFYLDKESLSRIHPPHMMTCPVTRDMFTQDCNLAVRQSHIKPTFIPLTTREMDDILRGDLSGA